jgi:hypothetical protein
MTVARSRYSSCLLMANRRSSSFDLHRAGIAALRKAKLVE